MKSNKSSILQFFRWLRNGTAFCTTWFLILILIFNTVCGIETITTDTLIQLFILSFAGVLLFCIFFTQLFIKKWTFTARLTVFMLAISLYECFGFYRLHFFTGKGSFVEWGIFIAIILILYFLLHRNLPNLQQKAGRNIYAVFKAISAKKES